MRVLFDKNARIAGIGIVPWTRLGPERWIDGYRIASFYGWDMQDAPGAPKVVALSDRMQHLPDVKLNTPTLLDTPEFRDMLTSELAGYSFMTYKPVQPPKELLDAGCKFLLMEQQLSERLENKAEFRQLFQDTLPFPEYRIIDRASITADEAGFREVMGGHEVVVVQDEILSGGRGTYIVRELADLQRALVAFEKLDGGKRLVVSKLVANARERSVQCVVTRYGVFVGPLQRQIVRHPLLSNMDVAEGDRFCGGVISRDDPLQDAYPTIKGYAEFIGKRLSELGYRGIFGLDCLVDAAGKVFVLEVNPRLTGMTPLLTMLYRGEQDIPFYLLHLLELAGVDYELADTEVDPVPPEGSLMILHSPVTDAVLIKETPDSGRYDLQGAFLEKQYRLNTSSDDTNLLVQRYTPPDFRAKPGGRLATVFVNKPILDESDQLKPEIEQFVVKMLDRVTLEKIEP